MKTDEQVLKDVVGITAEVLALGPEEVLPSSKFFEDLGGESIDVLELSFRCEQHFGIKLQFQDMWSADDLETNEQGRLTPEALSALERRFPFLDYAAFTADPAKNRLTELFTVEAIAHLVRGALAENAARG